MGGNGLIRAFSLWSLDNICVECEKIGAPSHEKVQWNER
jgi:hypothetical protein